MAFPQLSQLDKDRAVGNFQLQNSGILEALNAQRLNKKQDLTSRNQDFFDNQSGYSDLAPLAGGLVAGIAAAPFTAGASLPLALALAGGAGAVGTGGGQLLKEVTDRKEGVDFGNVLEQGAIGGAFNAGGLGLGRALQVARSGGSVSQLIGGSGDDLASLTGRASNNVSSKLSSAGGRSTSKGVKGKINDAGVRRFFNLNKGNTKAATRAGKNPLEIGRNTLSKLGIGADDYDDALGAVDTLGNGGKIGQRISQNSEAIKQRLAGRQIDVSAFYDDMAKKADQLRTIPGNQSRVAFLDDVVASRPPSTVLDGADAYDLKVALDDTFGKAMASGDDLTATAADVQKSYGNQIRKALGEDDLVANLTSENQDLIISRELLSDARDGLQIAGQNSPLKSISPINAINNIAKRPIFSRTAARLGTGSNVARTPTLSGALSGLGGTGTSAAQQAGGQLGGRSIQALMATFDQNDPIDAQIMQDIQEAGLGGDTQGGVVDAFGADTDREEQPQTLASAFSDPAVIQQLMIQDLQQTGGENISSLQKIFDIGGGVSQGGLDLNNTAITSISDTQAGIDQLGQLSELYKTSSANNPVIGRLRGLNPFDSDAQTFDSQLRLTRQIIGKALEGGVLRKEDEAKYSAILPNRGDTDASAVQKLELIQSDIQDKLDQFIQNQQQFGGGGQQSNSLADAMAQQGAF